MSVVRSCMGIAERKSEGLPWCRISLPFIHFYEGDPKDL